MLTKVKTTVEHFIEAYFPNCQAAFMAGSVVRGEATSQSDIDIVIISEEEKTMSRRCFIYNNWPIEVFVYNPSTFDTFFEGDCMLGNPFLPRMCAEGSIITGEQMASAIKEKATERLRLGPPAWTEDQIDYHRYLITDLLDDFIGSLDDSESIFIVNKLAERVHEFILRTNRTWTGEGKWVIRSLKQFDHNICDRFCNAFNSYYVKREKAPVVNFVDDVLQQHGGRLFEGYIQ